MKTDKGRLTVIAIVVFMLAVIASVADASFSALGLFLLCAGLVGARVQTGRIERSMRAVDKMRGQLRTDTGL